MPEDVRRRFQEGRADLLRHLEPTMDRPVFQLAGTDQAESRLDALEQARALHQVVGHAGALLQRARLPQADSLISQGLQISRLALRLRTNGPREPEHRQQAITELRTSVARFMANLTLARMQAPGYTVERQVCSLSEILRDAGRSLAQLARKQGVEFALELPECDPARDRVLTHYDRMRQLVMILGENGIKYTKPGGRAGMRLEYRPGVLYGRADGRLRLPAALPRGPDRDGHTLVPRFRALSAWKGPF